MKEIIDYWDMWHLLLATWLFIGLYFIWPKLNLKYTFLIALGIAIGWEAIEYFYNIESYSSYNAFYKNSLKDLLMALVSITFCSVVIGKSR